MAMQAVMSLPLPSSSCAHCPSVGKWPLQKSSVGAGNGIGLPIILKRGSAPGMEWKASDPFRSSIVVSNEKTARGGCSNGAVRCSAEAEAGVATSPSSHLSELNEGDVNEVDKDSFWPIIHSAAEKVVVLDMYTQWCGPCKLMLPKLVGLASAMDDVIFLKLDCNKHNKSLAKELGIRVVPTFKIFKNHKLVGEVTGAKFAELENAIDNARKM